MFGPKSGLEKSLGCVGITRYMNCRPKRESCNKLNIASFVENSI